MRATLWQPIKDGDRENFICCIACAFNSVLSSIVMKVWTIKVMKQTDMQGRYGGKGQRVQDNNGQQGQCKGGGSGVGWENQKTEKMESGLERLM